MVHAKPMYCVIQGHTQMGIPFVYANLCAVENGRVSERYTGILNRTASSKLQL